MHDDPKDAVQRRVDDAEDFLEPDDERPAGQDMAADTDPTDADGAEGG
jgi:hypothetical protein